MGVKYRITLTVEERKYLTEISSKGTGAARTVISARAILLLDRGDYAEKEQWTVEKVSKALGKSVRSLEYLKKRFVEEGLESAITRKQRETPPREVRFGGDFEAKLIALACSKPPEGRTRWTIRLLAEKVVELNIAPSVSTMTVCKTLKKRITASPKANIGRFHPTRMPLLSLIWTKFLISICLNTIKISLSYAWMNPVYSSSEKSAVQFLRNRDIRI